LSRHGIFGADDTLKPPIWPNDSSSPSPEFMAPVAKTFETRFPSSPSTSSQSVPATPQESGVSKESSAATLRTKPLPKSLTPL
jgi:hypothetical protein